VSDPADVADAIVEAIHSGDVARLRSVLAEHPDAASASLGGRYGTRTPMHVVTDWPGFFPNGPEIVGVLVEAGADPDPRPDPGDETPLHWAASAATTGTSPPPSSTPAPTSTHPTGPSAPCSPMRSGTAVGMSLVSW
jgi:hypothetical protein